MLVRENLFPHFVPGFSSSFPYIFRSFLGLLWIPRGGTLAPYGSGKLFARNISFSCLVFTWTQWDTNLGDGEHLGNFDDLPGLVNIQKAIENGHL